MKNRLNLILLGFLPFVFACGTIEVLDVVSQKLDAEGLWVPTEHTLEFMWESGYEFSAHSIRFKSDGTLVMTNIPSAWLFSQGAYSTDYYSGAGIWTPLGGAAGSDDPFMSLRIANSAGNEVTIEFDTVLDIIGFVPQRKPEELNWVTFQKCYPHLHITDSVLEPLVEALSHSQRDSLGFSPITLEDRIEIEGAVGTSDIWMHAYTDLSSHDIFFRHIDNEYIWVHEQENFTGPEEWVVSDAGTWYETIMLQYQTEKINGGPIHKLMVDYVGHDTRLANRSNNWYLSNNIEIVIPVLEEWRTWRAGEPPSPQSLCP